MDFNRKTIEKDEEYLRKVSTEVDFETEDYFSYIEKLKEYCSNFSVYALAPVQIGIPKRIIYIKNTTSDMSKNTLNDYDEAIILINPTIIESHGHTRFLEGCESCAFFKEGEETEYLVGEVDRPYTVTIEYFDINQNKKVLTLEGFGTTVFCHEFDHLNGVLHIDKINEVMKMNSDEMKKYRDEHPYQILSKEDK